MVIVHCGIQYHNKSLDDPSPNDQEEYGVKLLCNFHSQIIFVTTIFVGRCKIQKWNFISLHICVGDHVEIHLKRKRKILSLPHTCCYHKNC